MSRHLLILCSLLGLSGCFCVGADECASGGVGVRFDARGEAPDVFEVCFNGSCTGERAFSIETQESVELADVGMSVIPTYFEGELELRVYDSFAEYVGDEAVIRDGDIVAIRLERGGVEVFNDSFVVDYGRHGQCECTHRTIDIGDI